MNRFRRGILPRLLAAMVVAGTLLSVAVPFQRTFVDKPDALDRWLTQRFDSDDATLVAAMDAARAEGSSSPAAYVRALALAVVSQDAGFAAHLAGISETASETLVHALELLFGSAVEDALLPRALLISAKTAGMISLARISALEAFVPAAWRLSTFPRLHVPVASQVTPSRLRHFLSAVQPQGP